MPYIIQAADCLKDMIPKEALKNFANKDELKEEKITLEDSVDKIVFALSRPSAKAPTNSSKKESGYKNEQNKKKNQPVSEDVE